MTEIAVFAMVKSLETIDVTAVLNATMFQMWFTVLTSLIDTTYSCSVLWSRRSCRIWRYGAQSKAGVKDIILDDREDEIAIEIEYSNNDGCSIF